MNLGTVNIPPKIRFWIYIATGIGSIVVTYLNTVGVIHAAEVTAWGALSVFVSGLAAFNTPKGE